MQTLRTSANGAVLRSETKCVCDSPAQPHPKLDAPVGPIWAASQPLAPGDRDAAYKCCPEDVPLCLSLAPTPPPRARAQWPPRRAPIGTAAVHVGPRPRCRRMYSGRRRRGTPSSTCPLMRALSPPTALAGPRTRSQRDPPSEIGRAADTRRTRPGRGRRQQGTPSPTPASTRASWLGRAPASPAGPTTRRAAQRRGRRRARGTRSRRHCAPKEPTRADAQQRPASQHPGARMEYVHASWMYAACCRRANM
jgi:hypothetical protein